ncbi:MAG: hypothetical protein PHV05_06130 [Candidatus Riflebacteria bacterium]|nr:hypothetical protein [Candidatus Riflebacteria bacterium]
MEQAEKSTPHFLPLHGQDIFSFLASLYSSNNHLNMVITFKERIYENRLARAVRITMEMEPVLGCHVAEVGDSIGFVRRDDLDSLDLCEVFETTDPETDLQRHIALPIDAQKDPMVQVKILRTPEKDIVVVKMDHTCGDGGALKEYVVLLAKIYNNLCSNVSCTNLLIAPRQNAFQIMRQFGMDELLKAWKPSGTPPPPTWFFPCSGYQNLNPRFELFQLSNQQFETLKRRARENGATVNDILLTAYFRALFIINPSKAAQPRPVSVSVDLRRYLSETDRHTIANVSSSFNLLLAEVIKEPFSNTLERVIQAKSELNLEQEIIPSALFFEILRKFGSSGARKWFEGATKLSQKANFSPPFLSNIGMIAPVMLGESIASECYAVTPAMFAPLFMLGASTYNKTLTMVINYHASDLNQHDIKAFWGSMHEDLGNFCADMRLS